MPRFLQVPLLAACLFTSPFLGAASAVSVDELLNLKANGLSDDILVALIEADGSVFQLSADDVLTLHKKGLGEKIILAMLATSRRAAQETARQPIVEAPVPIVSLPVAIQAAPPIQQSIVQHVEVVPPEPVYVQVPVAFPVAIPVPVHHEKAVKPVYWGYGGALRPGSWRPAEETDRKPIDRDHPRSPR